MEWVKKISLFKEINLILCDKYILLHRYKLCQIFRYKKKINEK